MLIGNSGISWTQETCLFTGHEKSIFHVSNKPGKVPGSHFSRSSCYQYEHFQLKFSFDHLAQKKLVIQTHVLGLTTNHQPIVLTAERLLIIKSVVVPIVHAPPKQIRRLAYLGVFQI
jgi:hypothetical protein